MKPERKLKPLEPKKQKVKDLEGKKKAGEGTKETLERLEAKMDLLLSVYKKVIDDV